MSKFLIKEYQSKFNHNPRQTEVGKDLLDEQIKQRLYDDAGQTFRVLLRYTVLKEEYAMRILNQLEKIGEPRIVISLYEAVLEDAYYLNLAKQLTKYIRRAGITRKAGLIHFERMLAQFCFDFEQGSKFFKKFRKFEKAHKEQNKAIENNIRSLFQRQMKIPSKYIDLVWDEYKQWEQNELELQKQEQIYQNTSQLSLKVEGFEQLFRQVMSLQESLQVEITPQEMIQSLFQQYEDKEIELSKLINYLEMGLQLMETNKTTADQIETYMDIWTFFRGFLQENANANILLKYSRRATKLLPPSSSLYQLYLRCLEQCGKEQEQIEQEYQRLVGYIDNPYDKYIVMKARLFYYTRKATQNIDNIESQKENIRQMFQETMDQTQAIIYDERIQAQIDTLQFWAKVETYLFGDSQKSNQLFEQCVKSHNDQAKIWLTFLSLFNVQPFKNLAQRDKYRGLIKRACEAVKDDRETAILHWIDFESLFGSVDELVKAEQRLIQHYKQAVEQEEQDLELENDQEDEEDESSIVVEEEIPKGKRKKRKDIPNQIEEENKPGKRKRYFEQEQEQEDHEKIEKKVKTDQEEPKIFKDNESTLYVKNIPLDMQEEDFLELFPNKDQILECRFVRNQKKEFKGFAYVDFLNPNESERAAKEMNDKLVNGHKLYAAVSKPPRTTKDDSLTLFLNNLPYSVTEDKILEKLPNTQIQEIRIIKDSDGKPKGFAYVEFSDMASLSLAQSLLQEKPFIDGRKVFVEKADSLSIIKRKQQTQVIIIKNLSFRAREKHIQELFDGMELTQILIPKDINHKPKGFAFVEFAYHKDFQKALDMQTAKILGREVQILKSDREITQSSHKEQQQQPQEIDTTPKSNQDFKKFLMK